MKIGDKYTNQGRFNFQDNIVQFGGEKSKPENRFTCAAIKIPDYVIKVMERADAGGGCYYSYKEEVEYTITNAFLIIREGEVIGWMMPMKFDQKTDLLPIEWKQTHHPVKTFARKYQ